MHHQFAVAGRALYTGCTWGAPFIPQMLSRPALVDSPDPQTLEPVRLEVTLTGVASASHAAPVMSFLLPDGVDSDVLKTMAA